MNGAGPHNRLASVAACLLLTVSLAACTPARIAAPPLPPVTVSGEGELWWAVRFRLHWPDDATLDMSTDLMIAHALLAPLVHAYQPVLGYWRFHRRAARDASGHQFSLIFYASEAVARDLYRELEASPLLAAMLADGMLETVYLDETSYPQRARIEATSDPSWAPDLQRAWPAYIEGVSRTWLVLIDAQLRGDSPAGYAGLDAMRARYREADAGIQAIWQGQGQHAFLHHLSALFGYQPLLIQKLLRF